MPPGAVAGGVAVVIDTIRASTTITSALAHGAAGVFPVKELEQATAKAATLGRDTLLGGERGGIRIDGFDLGNSPREYNRDVVAGRQIVFTTTNGTAALAACRGAAVAMIGSFVNRAAVAAAARAAALERRVAIHLVCGGLHGEPSDDDTLGAGAILDAALRQHPGDTFSPESLVAREQFLTACGHHTGEAAAKHLATALANTPGGRNIIALGMQADLPIVAALDSLPLVPTVDPATGVLT